MATSVAALSATAGVSANGISSVVSVPSYLRCSVRSSRMSRAMMPCAATSARATSESFANNGSVAASEPASSTASTACWRNARTSASPMPYAESTPASGWMNTRVIPSASATVQACWPPAPPKQHSVYSVTS